MADTQTTVGTRARLRHYSTSAYKVRVVLDLIRNKPVQEAKEILKFCNRDPARPVGKLLASAIANAQNNDELDPDELYVSSCYADEAPTQKRWRPGARGRVGKIRKRSCHVTVVVSRLPEDKLSRQRASADTQAGSRRQRVEKSRQAQQKRTRKSVDKELANEQFEDVAEQGQLAGEVPEPDETVDELTTAEDDLEIAPEVEEVPEVAEPEPEPEPEAEPEAEEEPKKEPEPEPEEIDPEKSKKRRAAMHEITDLNKEDE